MSSAEYALDPELRVFLTALLAGERPKGWYVIAAFQVPDVAVPAGHYRALVSGEGQNVSGTIMEALIEKVIRDGKEARLWEDDAAPIFFRGKPRKGTG